MLPSKGSYPDVSIDSFIFFLWSLCKMIWMNIHYFQNDPHIYHVKKWTDLIAKRGRILISFSAPKTTRGTCTVQVHYCGQPLSVACQAVRPSVFHPSWAFQIIIFSSTTAKWNSTKLNRKQVLDVFYQVCIFRANWKTKMADPAWYFLFCIR